MYRRVLDIRHRNTFSITKINRVKKTAMQSHSAPAVLDVNRCYT